jgi:hypothetical protein
MYYPMNGLHAGEIFLEAAAAWNHLKLEQWQFGLLVHIM